MKCQGDGSADTADRTKIAMCQENRPRDTQLSDTWTE